MLKRRVDSCDHLQSWTERKVDAQKKRCSRADGEHCDAPGVKGGRAVPMPSIRVPSQLPHASNGDSISPAPNHLSVWRPHTGGWSRSAVLGQLPHFRPRRSLSSSALSSFLLLLSESLLDSRWKRFDLCLLSTI